ncbi:MAG: serine/threonine protein kinase [Planctomyces sp.]|nr:serine/threonine protein kinase [Planctomyces sp.]
MAGEESLDAETQDELWTQAVRICREFEADWRRGGRPDFGEFLTRIHVGQRSVLFAELVDIDIRYRTAAGEVASIAEYRARYPEVVTTADTIRAEETQEKKLFLGRLRQIGNFRLVEMVGSGEFGVVWKAKDLKLEREVAIKLPTDRSLTREYEAEFFHEAKSAARLSHQGIVPVFEYGIHHGFAFIVTEFVHGVTLKEWIRQKTITPRDAAELCEKIADALQHAHENGVIHRDLKPGNILIEKTGRPRITDFGLAKRLGTMTTVAGSGVVVGTYAYMSPEQATGESLEIDARSDVYSLGVLLYELLAKKLPFSNDLRIVVSQILNQKPQPLTELSLGIPESLAGICEKCLEKKPEDRYQSASELRDDLLRYLSDQPTLIKGPRQANSDSGTQRRRLLRLVAIGLMLISTVPISSYMMYRIAEGPPAEAANSEVDRTFEVIVPTSPAGSVYSVVMIDPVTGEPRYDQSSLRVLNSHLPVSLLPGLYQVNVSYNEADGIRRHSVYRTVPGKSMASGGVSWRDSPVSASGTVHWPVIDLPPVDVANDMVYVKGTDSFTVNGPQGSRTYEVSPFYVSSRLFTFGDFQNLRPGEDGWDKSMPATKQPPELPMPCRCDAALHWAEESGGRLLTELEFAWLAHLAMNAHQNQMSPSDVFEIPVDQMLPGQQHRRIEGILNGSREWTSTWVHSPMITSERRIVTPENIPADQFRVIRGVDVEQLPDAKFKYNQVFEAGNINKHYPNVGFRIARSAM